MMDARMEKELEITGGFKGNAGVALQEADFMLDHLPKNGVMVEIGTYHGVTAAYMATKRPDATIISVDPFPDPNAPRDRAVNIIGAADYYFANRRPNMRLFVGTTDDLCRFFGMGVVDAILVDGNHFYEPVLADLHACPRLLRAKGAIFAHDYGRPTIPDVEKACKTFCEQSGFVERRRVWHTMLMSQP
jgi:predicted O-methyltransferase YrrM